MFAMDGSSTPAKPLSTVSSLVPSLPLFPAAFVLQ
jgi:hypothetical protein